MRIIWSTTPYYCISDRDVYHPFCWFEIKLSASPHKDMVRSFRVLDGLGVPVGTGALICLASTSGFVTTNVITIPVDLI